MARVNTSRPIGRGGHVGQVDKLAELLREAAEQERCPRMKQWLSSLASGEPDGQGETNDKKGDCGLARQK